MLRTKNMMTKILVVQTAFIGDLILTMPLIQVLKKKFNDSLIDLLCIPETRGIVENNPLINNIIVYNKRADRSLRGLIKIIKIIRINNYDCIISPHRSFRSSFISYFSGCKETTGFDISSLSFLYKNKVTYIKRIHEIVRNLRLLEPLDIFQNEIVKPDIFIPDKTKLKIKRILEKNEIGSKFVVSAPGSVWFTKRFPAGKITEVFNLLSENDIKIFLIGSAEDKFFVDEIISKSGNKNLFNLCGDLSLLESAELIRLSALLITNDSAPLHIANAVDTKVIAIFGATVPSFGFFPYGKNDVLFETNGLKCRPCSVHGGNKCPIKSFDCMQNIPEEDIAKAVINSLS